MITYKFTAFFSLMAALPVSEVPTPFFENGAMNRLFNFVQLSTSHRTFRLSLAVFGWCVVGSVVAQEFPYVAYVTGEQAYVRSGPGQRYYPTGQVPSGYAVEVYRHDADGWCAIRPPAGSFSWIPSHQVRSANVGTVEIIDDNVVTRVGSTLSPVRSAVQVFLPHGDHVELLPAEPNDDPRWVRVAAPAGEFRWIAASELSREPPIEIVPVPQPKENGWSKQFDRVSKPVEAEPSVFDHLTKKADRAQAGGLQFGAPPRIPVVEASPQTPSNPDAMDIVAGSPAELQLAQFQAQSPQPMPLSATAEVIGNSYAVQPRVRFDGLNVTPSRTITINSVEELELQLSQVVVQSPGDWKLSSLEAAANSLLVTTKSPPVRAQLREVLERITQFQQIQQRYNNPSVALPINPDPFETPGVQQASGVTGMSSSVRERIRQDLEKSTAPAVRQDLTADEPLYDATGTLKPVVSKRESAPQYALVDERGKVVSFVTPTPDLNLQPYVGRQIGVHGTRGFMPEYRRTHVTAGRVTPIEGTVRR